jgi:hypothetical protein
LQSRLQRAQLAICWEEPELLKQSLQFLPFTSELLPQLSIWTTKIQQSNWMLSQALEN